MVWASRNFPHWRKSLCLNFFDLLQEKANAFFVVEVCTFVFHRQEQGLKVTIITNANYDYNGIQLSHKSWWKNNLTSQKKKKKTSLNILLWTYKKKNLLTVVLRWFLKG